MVLENLMANVQKKWCLVNHLDVICIAVGIENGKYLQCDKRMEQVLLLKMGKLKNYCKQQSFH